jgi:hypothetical protein
MIKKLKAKDITISEIPARGNLKNLFADNATVDMLEFVETTEVCKRLGAESNEVDSWDIERRV